MEFKINPLAYGSIFAVPAVVVDENLKMAGAVQLKAILYMLRHSATGREVSLEEISKATGYDTELIEDAMMFWQERGLVSKADGSFSRLEATAEKPAFTPVQTAKQPEAAKKTVDEIPVSRPSHEQIAQRCEECSQFRMLFSEAQQKLGKTIGYDGQSTLIMIHDSYGLPIEVILMLLEYAVSKGKTGYKSIAGLAKQWCERDIDTLEAAESYILEQSQVDSLWKEFQRLSGVKNINPTTKQRNYFSTWGKVYGFNAEMIYLAYEISIERTEKMSLAYMDKILRSWNESSIRTPMDVEKEQEKWREGKSTKKASKGSDKKESDSSYDLDAFAKKGIGLKYKKS